ncbi:MAG: OmpA family protein [Myxococcota bacterium]|nr:OmpA family protein [Myxococcota bacterium]
MRIRTVLLPLLLVGAVGVLGSGVGACHTDAQAKFGGDQPPPPPPPAPPPPASTTAEAPQPQPPPPPSPPRPVIALKGVQMKSATQIDMPGDIEFQKASAKIVMNDKTKRVLTQLAQIMKDNPEITKLSIEGNTDNEGEKQGFDNAKLSQQRAQSVIEWLEKGGIDAKRLSAVGNGSKNPVAQNDTPDHMALNRRVEFHVREFGGKSVKSEDGGTLPGGTTGSPEPSSTAVASGPAGSAAGAGGAVVGADTVKKSQPKKDKDGKDKPK